LGPGARSSARLGDTQAAALRGRFEQLLRGSGEGLPGVSQTVLPHDTPAPAMQRTPPPSSPAALHAIDVRSASATVQDKAPQDGCLGAPMPVADAADRSPPPHRAGPTAASEAAPPALTSSLAPGSPTAMSLVSTPAAATPLPGATAPEHATRNRADLAPENLDRAAVLSPRQAEPAGPKDVQAQQQQPAAQPQAARGERNGLPELLRDLVQAVVHMSRGREGQWRLTMALKPQVLDGTVVALDAQPGRLHVRFDCTATPASTRLNAVRDDLRLQLTEALSAVRAVDVSVEVREPVPTRAPDDG
jgi:Type III secretion protein (HpaP)